MLVALLILSFLLCNASGFDNELVFYGDRVFNLSARAAGTDKARGHEYYKMYGTFLLPMLEKFKLEKRKLKFLEIGLGCDMEYGPGASAALWKRLFKDREVELWEAEHNAVCVAESQRKGQLDGISALTGDQSDVNVLRKWIAESGGKFDVIIDDGGHRNDMILNSLQALWPELNPGGWYFVEDIHISYEGPWIKEGYPPTITVIQSWIETLTLAPTRTAHHYRHLHDRFPLPAKCDMILCQHEACAIHKEDAIWST